MLHMSNRLLHGCRREADSVHLRLSVAATLLHTLVRPFAKTDILGRTRARFHHQQMLPKLLTHRAVQDKIDGVVDQGDEVHRVPEQKVHVLEKIGGDGGHDDEKSLRHLGDDVHDDDDKQHGGGALMTVRLFALRVLALAGVGEETLAASGALMELFEQESDENGDEGARDELAHDGEEPKRG